VVGSGNDQGRRSFSDGHLLCLHKSGNSQKIAYCDLVLVCLSSAAKFGKALLVAASCPNPPNLVSDS
jgi:hypothetical protein